MQEPRRLSPAFSGALRAFSYWIANGTVGLPLLEGVAYRQRIIEDPGILETAYAIFANVMELNEYGDPLNEKYAEYRAAQWIRTCCDPTYAVDPPFEAWEQALY